MTPKQAEEKVRQVVLRSKRQHLRVQQVDEVKLRKLYRVSAGRISNIVMLGEGDLDRLMKIRADVARELKRLNDKALGLVTKHRDKSARMGIRGQIDSLIVYEKGFAANFKIRLNSKAFANVYHRAIRALEVPIEGITLSERIWRTHRITLEKINDHIARAMAEGRSLDIVAQEVKRFLIFPDSDMRKAKWRKFFRENPPGKGVYKSAHANTQRVLRTESNRSFREGARQYAATKGWVLGVRWNLVVAHPEYDVCDEIAAADMYGLGRGVYPPEGVPTSAHPHCLCFLTNIVKAEYLPASI